MIGQSEWKYFCFCPCINFSWYKSDWFTIALSKLHWLLVQWSNMVMKGKQAKYLVGRQFGPCLKELSNHFPVKVEKNLNQGYPVTQFNQTYSIIPEPQVQVQNIKYSLQMDKINDSLGRSKRPPNVATQPIQSQCFIPTVLPCKLQQ